MTNKEIFYQIKIGNHKFVLEYFYSFADSFYYYCKKQSRAKYLSEHQIKAVFDDACICMYDKIEAERITIRQMTSTVKTMIFGIGRNMIYQQARTEDRYHSLHSFLEEDINKVFNKEDENANFLRELQIKHLNEVLTNLTDKQYMLVVEGVMEGKSNIEIAKEQGYNSANAVSVEKLRAFKALKKSLLEL